MKEKPKKRRVSPKIDAVGLRTILDSMVEAVFVVDDGGRIVLTNRALDELLERDVRGARPKNLIRSGELRLAVRRARKQRVATEVEVEGAIGERPLTFRAQVSPMPGPGGVVVVLHDVTALKVADQVRRDFVANATHELRTPLTAIRGYAETLADGALAKPEVAESFVAGILRQTQRLQRLAEDLSLLSRAESAEQDYELCATDLAAVCHDSAASLEAQAKEKGLTIVLDVPSRPVIRQVSARALEEVLINLLENAIKHSRIGDEVRVTLRATPKEIAIEVRDYGVGISKKYHDRIFERFFRVDPGRSREEGGSGLGLAIVRHLLNRMGGAIALKSAPGKGARFKVILPAAK
jgi:two-component system phosphate regulon sensor histidine kinase PhoR